MSVKQKRKLLIKLKKMLLVSSLKLELKLKLKIRLPLLLPLLPRLKEFSFSFLAWMPSLPRLMLLLKPQ